MKFLPMTACVLFSVLLGTVLAEDTADALNRKLPDSRFLSDFESFAESGMPKLHQMKTIVEKARNLRKRECLSGILSSNCQQSKTNKEKGAINSNNNGDNYKNP